MITHYKDFPEGVLPLLHDLWQFEFHVTVKCVSLSHSSIQSFSPWSCQAWLWRPLQSEIWHGRKLDCSVFFGVLVRLWFLLHSSPRGGPWSQHLRIKRAMGRALPERHFHQISQTQSSHLKPLLYIGIPPRERENISPARTLKSNDFSELPRNRFGICFLVPWGFFFVYVFVVGEVQQKLKQALVASLPSAPSTPGSWTTSSFWKAWMMQRLCQSQLKKIAVLTESHVVFFCWECHGMHLLNLGKMGWGVNVIRKLIDHGIWWYP